ncbi:MAG TPA: SCO family protein [Thermoanaerobaculia bacterium]|nr:SCO family protein [Thermoanaerobaculia bacterium]
MQRGLRPEWLGRSRLFGRLGAAALLGLAVGGIFDQSLASPLAAPGGGGARAASGESAVVVSGSLRVPDVTVVDQDGRQVRFWSDLMAGKVVAVSFIFTTCTTICPPIGANFGRLAKLLDGRLGRGVSLISVSVDPLTDTPQRLKAWARQFGGGPGWTLVTGNKSEIDRLLKALQAYTPNYADHSPLILVGNAANGVWQRTSGLAAPAEIAKLIDQLISAPSAPSSRSGPVAAPRPRPAPPTSGAGVAPTSPSASVRVALAAGPPDSWAPVMPALRAMLAVRAAPAPPPSGSGPGRLASPPEHGTGAEPSPAHHYFTDVVLVDQDGVERRLYSDLLRGKTVVVESFFTTCTGACPVLTGKLAAMQDWLGERLGREVHLLSLSVDPETDTPVRLKQYAERLKAKAGWYFLTGKKDNVNVALAKLGLAAAAKQDHSNLLILGNEATGLWKKLFGLAPTEELIRSLDGVLHDRG